jgi:hypothetical protein
MDKFLLEIHKKRHPRNIAEHWLDSQKARKEKRKAKKPSLHSNKNVWNGGKNEERWRMEKKNKYLFHIIL